MRISNQRLTEARESAGLSVLDLAVLLHVQTGAIYAAEKPGSRAAGPKLLAKYEAAGLLSAGEVLEHLRSDAA